MTDEEQAVLAEYDTLQREMQRYVNAEAGVARDQRPQSLRVGLNTAMSDAGALVKLLVEKGVFTDLEYFTAIRDMMRRELSMRQNAQGGLPENGNGEQI